MARRFSLRFLEGLIDFRMAPDITGVFVANCSDYCTDSLLRLGRLIIVCCFIITKP